MYRKGESATATFTYPNILGSAAIVSVSPIYHLGKIVGFTWASKFDYALTEGLITLNKGIIIGFFAWLMLMVIVRTVFQKLNKSLMRFARQVTEENLPPVKFKDFPQLEPLFDTVIKLREDLKRETEHYAEESQTLKNLLKLTPLVILMIDRNGIIKACNQEFLKLYPQYESENLLLNMPYKELTDSTNRIYEEVPAARAIRGEEIHNEYSFYLNKYWLTSAVPLRNNEGHIIGSMAIGHDITEYEKLRKEMVRLDRLNIVGQMAASVAHEVRNPMTVARGYIQSLEKKTGDIYSSQFHTIIEELDRANHIISDFLSLARDKYVEKQKESLSTIIQEILPMVESEALVRNINCHTRIDGKVPLLLLNSEEIKQLI
jgi:PAS domain S-box-containing protein